MKPAHRRRWIHLTAFSAACLCGTAAVVADDLPADLQVERVTVYREGAAVTRAGRVEIPAGSHRLLVRGLPASIDAKTLRVAIDSAAVRLGGLEVARVNEGRFASAPERDLRRKIEETSDQRQVAQDEAATAQLQLKLLESLAANPAGSPDRASVDAGNLSAVLSTMSVSAGAARRHVRDSNHQLRTLDKELERLKANLAKVATQSKQSTEIRTALESSVAATATVSVTYTIPEASWRWIYEARLDTKQKRINLERQGQVQQGSGEDWKNVEVTLTTALPLDNVATPVVNSLFVAVEEPEPPRERAVRAQSALALRGLSVAAAPVAEMAVTAARKSAQASATEYLAEYTIPGRVTVQADREPRMYPIGDDAFDVDLVARVVPSAGHAAHLEATFKYAREVPIESGRMQLYRDGAYVGEAENKTLLPGADVRLPFGVDQRILVAVHDEEEQSGQRGIVSKQLVKETRHRYDITNYHPVPIAVEVVDRIPVSKHSDVRVEILKGATEPTSKDVDGKAGVMLWNFNAQPQKLVAIRHYYSIQYPRDRQLSEAVDSASD